MSEKKTKFNTWKFIQFSGFILITLGIIFSFSSFRVSLLLYFGFASVLIGSINILIYYIFIGTNSYTKYLRKQNNNKLILNGN